MQTSGSLSWPTRVQERHLEYFSVKVCRRGGFSFIASLHTEFWEHFFHIFAWFLL